MFKKKNTNPHLVSCEHYAKLCGVTPAAIRARYACGSVQGQKISGCIYIDILLSPVDGIRKGGRKKAEAYL